ncbi:MAG: hypothetical protein RIK87_21795 [Fuerstiella sp.]
MAFRQMTRADLFLIITLLSETLLIAATWPLWTQAGPFPAVPCMSAAAGVSIFIDRMLLIGLLGAMLFVAGRLFWRRNAETETTDQVRQDGVLKIGLLAALLSAAALTILNQHRLQAWHWLFMLLLVQKILIPRAELLRLWRLSVAVIYIFAAVSRLGPDVAQGMSREVVYVLAGWTGLHQFVKSEPNLFVVCLLLTLAELAVGVVLAVGRIRRVGVISAMVLHGTLILVLSPLGLNHHPGVLGWNLYFLLAVPVLFGLSNRAEGTGEPQQRAVSLRSRVMICGVVLFPLSGLCGLADNWLSWQLYSPRPEVVRVFVHLEAVHRLPPAVRPFVGQPPPLSDWCPVRIDRWSLADTGSPVYPEDRFQLAVAGFLMTQAADGDLRAELDAPQVPGWWHRRVSEFRSSEALQQRQKQFYLNSEVIRTGD